LAHCATGRNEAKKVAPAIGLKTQSPRDAIALSPTKSSIWTTASGPGGDAQMPPAARQRHPDGIGQPYLEKPAGMLPSRYAWLLDRLDAAEDDLDLPLTLGGLRFAYRPDRNRLRDRAVGLTHSEFFRL